MADTDLGDIRRLDGGLLLVFQELCRTPRTTAVAKKLGLSQSAVSHALSRLRDVFRDPLFIRRPHGLEPTGRALQLAPRVDALIDMMAASLRPDGAFDPARSARRFNIALTEYAVGVVGGELVSALQVGAPRVSFMQHHLRGYIALSALRRGLVDLAVGRFDAVPQGFQTEPLFEDRYCVVARVGHSNIQGSIDEKAWRNTGHVFVSAASMTDEVLGPALGEDPLPSATDVVTVGVVPRWETALSLVAGSDTIATGPRRLAEQLAPQLGLQVIEPKPAFPSWTISIVRRDDNDEGLDWFCGQMREHA